MFKRYFTNFARVWFTGQVEVLRTCVQIALNGRIWMRVWDIKHAGKWERKMNSDRRWGLCCGGPLPDYRCAIGELCSSLAAFTSCPAFAYFTEPVMTITYTHTHSPVRPRISLTIYGFWIRDPGLGSPRDRKLFRFATWIRLLPWVFAVSLCPLPLTNRWGFRI